MPLASKMKMHSDFSEYIMYLILKIHTHVIYPKDKPKYDPKDSLNDHHIAAGGDHLEIGHLNHAY